MTYECWNLADCPADTGEYWDAYRDGRNNEPAPGENRSPEYHHGWWCGMSDGHHCETPPWMRELAKQFIAASRPESAYGDGA